MLQRQSQTACVRTDRFWRRVPFSDDRARASVLPLSSRPTTTATPSSTMPGKNIVATPGSAGRRLRTEEGPWAISAAETPHDPSSYSLYIKSECSLDACCMWRVCSTCGAGACISEGIPPISPLTVFRGKPTMHGFCGLVPVGYVTAPARFHTAYWP